MSIIYKSKWSQHPDTHSVMAAATPVEVLDTKEEMWDCWLSISRRQKSTEENSDYCEAEASQRRGGKTKTCSADVAEKNIRGWNSHFPGTAEFCIPRS